MTRRVLPIPALLLGTMLAGAAAGAAPPTGDPPVRPPGISAFSYPRLSGPARPDQVLAQRTIFREWGPSDDSIYVVIEIEDWKSEPLAAALSAALPGAGQRYAGERGAWLFAAAEVAGWSGWWWYRRDARRLRDDAASLVGPPDDPASAWSFERWATATQNDPDDIAALYLADREAFFNRIASDPRYLAGWENDGARIEFGSLRVRSDQRLGRSRSFVTALWLNHLVAALDALRAARFHNLPLTRELGVRLDGGMRRGRPTFALALERKL